MACLVAKLSNSSYDIRKPYTEIGGRGVYSGRHYDETYIAPFAFRHNLPVNPTTSFLTPAFRTNKSVIKPGVQLIGRPRKLYDTVVDLVTIAHTGKVLLEDLLAETVRWVLLVRNERQQRMQTLFAS